MTGTIVPGLRGQVYVYSTGLAELGVTSDRAVCGTQPFAGMFKKRAHRYAGLRMAAGSPAFIPTAGANDMDDIKASTAKYHEDAAHQFEVAAKMHHEAAKHCASGNFEKSEHLATTAAEAEAVANRHALEALNQYRRHAQEVGDRKAEAAAEEAARVAKHESKEAAKT